MNILTGAHNKSEGIPYLYLCLKKGEESPFRQNVSLEHVPIGAKNCKGQLDVIDAEKALKNISNWPSADDVSGWVEAYRRYNRKFWPEIVAVAWRIIAINTWQVDHIQIDDLRNAIRDYLNKQDTLPKHLQVSDESLLALASNVVKQFKTGTFALKEPVLVNPRRT